MTEPTGTTTPPEGGQQAPQWTPPVSQQEFDRIIGERLAREKAKFADYDEIKAKAARLDDVEQANLTELQREKQGREAAEKQLTPLQIENAKLRVAMDKKLDASLVDRLRGNTKEELEADADELLKIVKPAAGIPSYDGGGRTTAPAGASMNDVIRQAAGYGQRN